MYKFSQSLTRKQTNTQGFRIEGLLMQEIVTQVMELRSQRAVNQHRDYNRRKSLSCLGWRDMSKGLSRVFSNTTI